MENSKMKAYEVWISPHTSRDANNVETTSLFGVTNPDPKSGQDKQKFYTLELSEKSPLGPLGISDAKSYTLVIFENSHDVIFKAITMLLEEKKYVSTSSGNAKLNDPLWGRVVKRPCPKFVPHNWVNGQLVEFKVKKKINGWEEQSTTRDYVRFFMFGESANDPIAEELAYQDELARIEESWFVEEVKKGVNAGMEAAKKELEAQQKATEQNTQQTTTQQNTPPVTQQGAQTPPPTTRVP